MAEALDGILPDFGIELGDMRQLRVREVGSKLTMDIREFYDKDGTPAPGKKGTTRRRFIYQAACGSSISRMHIAGCGFS